LARIDRSWGASRRYLCGPTLASAAALTATNLLSQGLLPHVLEVADGDFRTASSRGANAGRAPRHWRADGDGIDDEVE